MNAPHSDAMGVLIQADLDGELDAVQAADLALHVAGCEECRLLSGQLRVLKAELRSTMPRFQAPPALREAVLRQMGHKPAASPLARRLHWRHLGWRRLGWRRRAWLPAFGGFLGGAVIAALLAVIVLPAPPTEERGVATEVATATERSLELDHLLDIRSTVPSEIAEWFRARMNFAPPVRQPSGFQLVGGRLDYLHHRPVAVLAYDHRGGAIELYTWPEEHAPTLPKSLRSAGFALSYWREGGIEYWAIGRSPADLARFVQAWHRSGA